MRCESFPLVLPNLCAGCSAFPPQANIPVHACCSGRPGVAPIGLTNMLNTGGAVTSVEVGASKAKDAALIARVQLRGSGTFLAWASARPKAVAVNGREGQFEWDGEQGAVRVQVPATKGLNTEVDILMPSA